MITVTYDPPEMVFWGHAGYAARGQDIVCAAVSALYGTLALQDGVTMAGNRAVSRSRAGEQAMAMIWRGVKALAEQYPRHITALDGTKGNRLPCEAGKETTHGR